MRRSWIVACFVVVGLALPFGVPSADASVGCGAVIKRSVRLRGDILGCATPIRIVRSRVVFDLGGHSIFGGGIVVNGASRVTIENGTIGFATTALDLRGRGIKVRNMRAQGNTTGLVWGGRGGSVTGSRFVSNAADGLDLLSSSAGSRFSENSFTNDATGALIEGRGSLTHNVFLANAINGATAVGNGSSFVSNYFNENVTDGLHFGTAADVVVARNIANYNGAWGINGDVSAIDRGGDLAKGNGQAKQCHFVACN